MKSQRRSRNKQTGEGKRNQGLSTDFVPLQLEIKSFGLRTINKGEREMTVSALIKMLMRCSGDCEVRVSLVKAGKPSLDISGLSLPCGDNEVLLLASPGFTDTDVETAYQWAAKSLRDAAREDLVEMLAAVKRKNGQKARRSGNE